MQVRAKCNRQKTGKPSQSPKTLSRNAPTLSIWLGEAKTVTIWRIGSTLNENFGQQIIHSLPKSCRNGLEQGKRATQESHSSHAPASGLSPARTLFRKGNSERWRYPV